MSRITWLASYPRSGNTWLRFLLADLLHGAVSSSDQVANGIPDIEWGIRAAHLHGPRRTVIKTHWMYHPALPLREDTIGVVYIVRNPLDVMLSALNHARLNSRGFPADMSGEALQEASHRWIADYIVRGGADHWAEQGFGTWEQNVESWMWGALPFRRLVLKYEDLHRDPAPALRLVSGFLGRERDPERIAAAIERCSFAAMRAMEEREMKDRRPGTFFLPTRRPAHLKGVRFVHRGEVGAAESSLTPDEREAAMARFGPAMQRLGYA